MKKEKIQSKHIEKLKAYGITILGCEEIALFKYKQGEEILREGFPMEYLLFVVSGKAKVYACSTNGRDLLLSYYVSNGLIGDIELMMEEYTANKTLVAVTEFVCIALPFTIWTKQLKNNIAFLNCVGQSLAEKLIQTSNKSVVTTLHAGEERLCTYILQATPNEILSEKLTLVASSIGISYRHTLRILKTLCEKKILKKEENGYRVIDRSALQNLTFIKH